ncbi:PAS-domain containing protein [Paenibacillus sp. KQZ6P-2]|uniref:PAS-domain containing protein n=1 Tax=Paenibacillus mangrovi TaxID=2931978 RepID=A0A9X2B5U0_9BACL|nr:PAS-domain containing protein [Paenibacillus mangrovi]MCJ8013127.1 PAS-domain containing protein [Paenibacillus mangrovi]
MLISNISSLEIIHSLKQAIAVLDSKGYILSVNQGWIQNSLTGVPESFNWTGVNFLQIFAAIFEADGPTPFDLDAVLNGTLPHFRTEFQSPFERSPKWFSFEASTIFHQDSHTVKGMIVYFTDITKNKTLEHDLMEALTQIRTLRGLLPICAVCKRIRDEHDIWNSVESFLEKHTPAEFTHDICPECIRRLYPKYSSVLDDPSRI